MEYVYHGSKIHNLKTLKPHESTHGNYLYATPNKIVAILMSKCCGSDITYTLSGDGNGHYDLIERIPNALDKMYANDASIYTLPSESFKDIHTGFNEVVSKESVDVVYEEYIPNLYEKLNELEEYGYINIYYYPDRPNYIPEDDSDLVDKLKNYVYNEHKTYDVFHYAKWIFAHPNLESKIREIAEYQGVYVPPYDEIKQRMIETQEHDPSHELFIDSSILMYDLLQSKRR